jgi:hypothetical protein
MTVEQLQLINLAIPVIFGLVSMLWGIIATILNYKSVPVSEVNKLLTRSEVEAAKSETPLDDKAVEIAKTLFQQMVELGLIKETPAAPVSTTTTTTSEPLYNPAEADRS